MAARLAIRCLLAVCLLSPAPALSAESVRTLAIADFAVRAPEGAVAESVWLGPAVSELLQAKMQFFGGARVLERQRVRGLLREAKADAGAAMDDPGMLSGILPAEVLIAGSVSVDPKDPRRIRVQARAFEVETSKIVSEAAFSGTGDLAGLLKIAEDLAQTLADGLKLPYTPEQLAYAEPAKIDTLKLFLDGNDHFLSGQWREAIESYQKALDGNGGNYYAAAHRMQGEAYQALAKAKEGPEGQKAKEEYLKKFKDDALAVSGALFDLGLAYEANGMWQEAVGAFNDYVDAIWKEGETVRWRLDLKSSRILDEADGIPNRFLLEGTDKLHFFAGSQWIVLNPATGEVVDKQSLKNLLGLPDQETYYNFYPAGIEDGVIYLVWSISNKDGSKNGHSYHCWAVAIGCDRKVIWKKQIAQAAIPERLWWRNGLLYLYANILPVDSEGRQGGYVLKYDLLTLNKKGELLSRVELSDEKNNPYHVNGPQLQGIDLSSGKIALADGLHDLATGNLIHSWEMVNYRDRNGAVIARPRIQYPTGLQGITWEKIPQGVRLLQDGKEAIVLTGSTGPAEVPTKPVAGTLLFIGWNVERQHGYLLINPLDWTVTTLYGDLPKDSRWPAIIASADSHVLFKMRNSDYGEPDPKYGLPTDKSVDVLNLFEAHNGRLIGKHRVSNERQYHAFLIGADICVVTANEIVRLSIVPPSGVVPAAEARLRLAKNYLLLGDLESAKTNLAFFESAFTGDPRAYLPRMRLATLDGKSTDAARYALKALVSRTVEQGETEPCLKAIRKVYPQVRDAVITPAKSKLYLVSMAGPGIIVATPSGRRFSRQHLLVDMATKRTTIRETPEAPTYRGGVAYGKTETGDRILRIDLRNDERIYSDPYVFHQGAGVWRIDGFPLAFALAPADYPPPKPGVRLEWKGEGYRPDVQNMDVLSLNPATLAPLVRVPVPTIETTFSDDNVVAFAETRNYHESADMPVVVLDRISGRELYRAQVPLRRERIRGVVADRETLVVTIVGSDLEAMLREEKGAWLRVESYPLGSVGARWTYEAEGWMGSNPVLEEGRVSFAGYEGKISRPVVENVLYGKECVFPGKYSLKRISLDRVDGHRLGDEPIGQNPGETSKYGSANSHRVSVSRDLCHPDIDKLFFPKSPRRMFAGRKESLWYARTDKHNDYWFYTADKPPLLVGSECGEEDCRLIGGDIVWKDIVYESIGGGVILIKDFDGGKGMENIASSISW